MCLRCQCILILSPGPKRDAPHRCSLLGVDFNDFKSQSVKKKNTEAHKPELVSNYRKKMYLS